MNVKLWENICSIYNSTLRTLRTHQSNMKNNPIGKWAKDMNRPLQKRNLKLPTLPYIVTKTNSKWIKNLNLAKTIKLSEEKGNISVTLDLVIISWIWYQKHRQQKKKEINWTLSKCKIASEDTLESKDSPQMGGNICKSCIWCETNIQNIWNPVTQQQNETTQLENGQRIWRNICPKRMALSTRKGPQHL